MSRDQFPYIEKDNIPINKEGARDIGRLFGLKIGQDHDLETEEEIRQFVDASLNILQLSFCQGLAESLGHRFWESLTADRK